MAVSKVEKRRKKRPQRRRDASHSGRQRAERVAKSDISPHVSGIDEMEPALEPKFYLGSLSNQDLETFGEAEAILSLPNRELLHRADSGQNVPRPVDRVIYATSVVEQAAGKEVLLAMTATGSRLIERLVCICDEKGLRKVFAALLEHLQDIILDRFGSRCLQTLFLRAAVSLSDGWRQQQGQEEQPRKVDGDHQLESAFLRTLDVLHGGISALLLDANATHPLRVLLLALSGRPLAPVMTEALTQSLERRHLWPPPTKQAAAGAELDAAYTSDRSVPVSFKLALRKLLADTAKHISGTTARLLATHPSGSPTLQLMLELDLINVAVDTEPGQAVEAPADGDEKAGLLASCLFPGSPAAFAEEGSPATVFLRDLLCDRHGSRLAEVMLRNCSLHAFTNILKQTIRPQFESLAVHAIAAYPLVVVAQRCEAADCQTFASLTMSTMPQLVQSGRWQLISTVLQRVGQVGPRDGYERLFHCICQALRCPPENIVERLCLGQTSTDRTRHACRLVEGMLSVEGSSRDGVQAALTNMTDEALLALASGSKASAGVLMRTFVTPSRNRNFHKELAFTLLPHTCQLAMSEPGSRILRAMLGIPSKPGPGFPVHIPFHIKEQIARSLADDAKLASDEHGRGVCWHWRIPLWQSNRSQWLLWARAVDPAPTRLPDRIETEPDTLAAKLEPVTADVCMTWRNGKRSRQMATKQALRI